MTDAEYLATQAGLLIVADIVEHMPLDEFIGRGELALEIAPIVDPTAYIRGAATLERVLAIARATRDLQRVILTERNAPSVAAAIEGRK